jgi:hypothetical protein
MAIPDSDPRAKELDAAFEAAANGPARPRAEAKTPAEVDQDAPFGRAEDGSPITPYGTTKDGRVKRSAGGRPAKDSPDHARTGEQAAKPEDAKPGNAKPEPHDWTSDLDGFGDAIWFGLTAVSQVAPKIPIVSKLIPGEKLAAQACVLSEMKPRMVAAVNLAAQHNAKAEKFCKSLEGGDGLWALTAMSMVLPVVSLSMTVWTGKDAEFIEQELPSRAEMAKHNEAKWDDAVTRINAAITAATEAAMQPQAAEGVA